MNSFLLYSQKSITGEPVYPAFSDIYKDLNLNIILKTMAQNDAFLMEHIRTVMMVPVCDTSVLDYRHAIIKDFQQNEELMDLLYSLGRKGFQIAEQYKKEIEHSRGKTAIRKSVIITSLNFISDSIDFMKQIREALAQEGAELHSEGLKCFSERISGYPLDDLEDFHNQIMFYTMGGEGIFSIKISGGLKLESSRLQKCRNYKLSQIKGTSRKLLKLYYKVIKKDTLLIEDEALEKDIHRFLDLNLQKMVDLYAPYIENCLSFLFEFSKEIAFYKGIHNMQRRMKELSLPLCYGEVDPKEKVFENLYELSLALYMQVYPVPNSLESENNVLTIITGANQGGKSTFLRSFGIAQVMLQCGMPVPADRFCSGLYSKIHTHFTRKEDAMLSRGRLEEELKRMSSIISQLSADSLVLLNESFASTTEKEGSQIAYNIIMPLYKKKIEIMMVTHLHEFARKMYDQQLDGTEFLVAERKENGERTFHMLRGRPHYSSYGTDLYQYIIGEL